MVETVKFLVFLFLFVFLPGKLIVTSLKAKFSTGETIFLPLALGIPILAFLAWVLGYLRLGILLLPILLLGDLYLFFFRRWRPKLFNVTKEHIFPIVIVLLGAIFQSLLMVKSGTAHNGGLAFWGVHGYDAIWHSALIQELTNNFPPQNPGFAGELLKNYHFLTDLFLSQIHKYTGIPILDLYFRFCPIFFTIVLNALIYLFARRWSGNRLVAAWAVFFASIAGSFGWIPPLFGRGSNNWETAFWGIQPTSAFLNPPFGVSLILLMADLLLLDYFLKEKDKRVLPLVIFLSGIMIGFKIYGGIVLLGALGVLGGLRLLKREPGLLLAFFGGLCLTLLVYLPAGSGSTNYLVWKPWWFIQTMIEAPDRLNWPSLELRRQVYVAYHNWRNIIILQTFAFLIFLFGNLGTRFFGFISFAKGVLRKKETDTLLALIALLAFLPPIFFVQKVVPWNSIQFLYYFTFIFSFFAAVSVVSIISKLKQRIIKTVFVLVVVLAAMPSTIETIHWFTAPTPTTFLDKSEIEALRFLKNNSLAKDVLLTYPFEESQQKNYPNPPVPMTYYNSPYVSFFTARRVYLEDQNSARILSYDLLGRLGKEKFFFGTDDPNAARSFLTDNQIIYIYMVDNQAFKLSPERIGVKEIFNNQKVRIYKVI